jgi:hypothetical protein
MKIDNKPVEVTGIHLFRLGSRVIVKAEIDGHWVEVIREVWDANFSHIVEPGGMRHAAEQQKPKIQ